MRRCKAAQCITKLRRSQKARLCKLVIVFALFTGRIPFATRSALRPDRSQSGGSDVPLAKIGVGFWTFGSATVRHVPGIDFGI